MDVIDEHWVRVFNNNHTFLRFLWRPLLLPAKVIVASQSTGTSVLT
jgi:hypothetical protein